MSRILICGPTCSGKTFLAQRFEERGFSRNVSFTTRPVRKGEEPGISYHFVSEETFEGMLKKGMFHEWSRHMDNFYGTGKEDWETKDVFIKEPNGIAKLSKEDRENSFIIYINIPIDIINDRLALRGLTKGEIQERIQHDQEKFSNFEDYDLKITNPNF